VDALLVLVPDAVGGKLEVAVGAGEVFLFFLRVFLQPMFLESILKKEESYLINVLTKS